MNLNEALKVAQKGLGKWVFHLDEIGVDGDGVAHIKEAAAALARLEVEWPKLKAAVDVVADMLDPRVDDLLAAFARLDAAPKEEL